MVITLSLFKILRTDITENTSLLSFAVLEYAQNKFVLVSLLIFGTPVECTILGTVREKFGSS